MLSCARFQAENGLENEPRYHNGAAGKCGSVFPSVVDFVDDLSPQIVTLVTVWTTQHI
ncbi:MAG TPA: hypothetical protein VFI82_12995 [Terriglobales bacterium]|nr:hypothetical protein [Terriglobales bacterium]